jgi:hypothetical protein
MIPSSPAMAIIYPRLLFPSEYYFTLEHIVVGNIFHSFVIDSLPKIGTDLARRWEWKCFL